MIIKDLPEAVHRCLSERAAENGRTPEGEARFALEERFHPYEDPKGAEDWLKAIESIQAALRAANGGALPKGVVDELLAEKREIVAAELARVESYLSRNSGGADSLFPG